MNIQCKHSCYCQKSCCNLILFSFSIQWAHFSGHSAKSNNWCSISKYRNYNHMTHHHSSDAVKHAKNEQYDHRRQWIQHRHQLHSTPHSADDQSAHHTPPPACHAVHPTPVSDGSRQLTPQHADLHQSLWRGWWTTLLPGHSQHTPSSTPTSTTTAW